jgi:hypothetical protein
MIIPVRMPSVERAVAGLPPAYRDLLLDRYQRILPLLLQLLRPHDIRERNRAWPGVRPTGKGANGLLLATHTKRVQQTIDAYTIDHPHESTTELWSLIRAYCQYGPTGLLDALPSSLPPLLDPDLQACVDFHRLAKHRRADAGSYLREVLARYATNLHLPPVPTFVARYAFAQDRRSERWFLAEGNETLHIPKTDRRLNRDLAYPHQQWRWCARPLPGWYALSERHPQPVTPWLLWLYECLSGVLMGLRVCATHPSLQDVLLTLRWSIWHYDVPTWKHRGAPKEVLLPGELIPFSPDTIPALTYLHTCLVWEAERGVETAWPGFPEELRPGIEHSTPQQSQPLTLAALYNHLLSELGRDAEERFFTAPSPGWSQAQGVSLPWSTGIAATRLLPSGGETQVVDGKVDLFDVPFDASELADGTVVERRYDPDDARTLYLIHHGARVTPAPASAFEGARVSWLELVSDPQILD